MRRLLFRLLASAPDVSDHVPDAELLRRFVASNDSAAFELIVRRHADAVWSAVFRILRNEADSEDAFQAAFLALIRKAKQIRATCVGGWLHRVAVHAALKVRERAAQSTPTEPTQLDAIPASTSEPPDPDRAATVHEELARLSERERLPVVLCDLEGMSHADAATALGWPVGTVSGRLSRARAKLRDRLARRGVTPSAALLPALMAPPHLIPKALTLTSGSVPPAIASLAEGVLAMNATQTWKWIAAVTCAGALGAGAVFAFGPTGVKPPPNVPAPAVGAPVAAQNPDPPAKDKEKPADEGWIPKRDKIGEPIKLPDGIAVQTAFPELAIKQPEPNDPKRFEILDEQFAKLCPHFAGKADIKIDATDDKYRKVLKARLYQGVEQIVRVRAVIRAGNWNSQFFAETLDCLVDIEATCSELWSGQPKELIPWLEELVVLAKEQERFHLIRVQNGTDPPHRLNAATRHRLRAEAALLKAKNRA